MKIGHERFFFATATDCAGAAASIFSSWGNLLAGKEGGGKRKVYSSPPFLILDDKDVRRHILGHGFTKTLDIVCTNAFVVRKMNIWSPFQHYQTVGDDRILDVKAECAASRVVPPFSLSSAERLSCVRDESTKRVGNICGILPLPLTPQLLSFPLSIVSFFFYLTPRIVIKKRAGKEEKLSLPCHVGILFFLAFLCQGESIDFASFISQL